MKKSIFGPLKHEKTNLKSSVGTYFHKIVEIISTGLAGQLAKNAEFLLNAGLGIFRLGLTYLPSRSYFGCRHTHTPKQYDNHQWQR